MRKKRLGKIAFFPDGLQNRSDFNIKQGMECSTT